VKLLGEVVFVGLGLNDEMGISLRGLQEVRTADRVFAELYTSLLPDFSMQHFERISETKITFVSREELEERNGETILEAAEAGKVVLLVPGDPLIATTHVTLRIEAQKRGIKTRVVHGASALSAVIGLSGLHNYKFGKTVTIPFPENYSETPYRVIAQNRRFGLHTLCLLDIQTDEKRYLSINEGLKALMKIEQKRKKGIATIDTLVVGIARAGSESPIVKAGLMESILAYDFGKPPYSMIFPGKLHFMEAEALIVLASGPEDLRRMTE